jgi:hypothetical protein
MVVGVGVGVGVETVLCSEKERKHVQRELERDVAITQAMIDIRLEFRM